MKKYMKAITFSFDDGVEQDVRVIELLDKYNLKGTFNLNSARFGGGDVMAGYNIVRSVVHEDKVKERYKNHEVAAHTLTHRNLTTLSDEEVIREVEEDRKKLSQIVGYEVVGLAYPCGGINNDDRVAELIKNHTGVKYCRTTISTKAFDNQSNMLRFNPTTNIRALDIFDVIERFLAMETDVPQTLYIWGHAYECDMNDETISWEKLEKIFALCSGHDDVYYGTNTEVFELFKAI